MICLHNMDMYIILSAWLRPSLPQLIKGWFDHKEANCHSFPPPLPPLPGKNMYPNRKTTYSNRKFDLIDINKCVLFTNL